MYVEFGIGEILEPRPLLYAITHQVSCPSLSHSSLIKQTIILQVLIYFTTAFMVTLGGLKWNDPMVLKLGSVALSGFFTYEVCRKLDPTHLRVSNN